MVAVQTIDLSAQDQKYFVDVGHSPFYAVSVNCLYRDRVSGRVMDRVRHPDSSGNLLIRRKMDNAR